MKLRGIANADKSTRIRVARIGGLSEHRLPRGLASLKLRDPLKLQEIAKQGGQATKRKHQHDDFHSMNGTKGGQTVAMRFGAGYFSDIAKRKRRKEMEKEKALR